MTPLSLTFGSLSSLFRLKLSYRGSADLNRKRGAIARISKSHFTPECVSAPISWDSKLHPLHSACVSLSLSNRGPTSVLACVRVIMSGEHSRERSACLNLNKVRAWNSHHIPQWEAAIIRMFSLASLTRLGGTKRCHDLLWGSHFSND